MLATTVPAIKKRAYTRPKGNDFSSSRFLLETLLGLLASVSIIQVSERPSHHFVGQSENAVWGSLTLMGRLWTGENETGDRILFSICCSIGRNFGSTASHVGSL